MKFLLDTHALLWVLLNDSRLSVAARAVVEDESNDLLVSPASLWEIAIKISLGKYELGEDYATFMEREMAESKISLLPITVAHTAIVASLPYHHRDPFDRLLIAQAMAERVRILSRDKMFDKYQVPRTW